MKARTKKILNFALIFGTLAIVLIVSFSGQEMSGAVSALKSVAPKWIILCIVAYLLFVMMEALAVTLYLRRQGYNIHLPYVFYVSILGQYYCNVTPGATGGQPMQIYYRCKRKIPIGIGTSALTVRYFAFQFMLMVAGTVLWIAYRDFIAEQVGGSMWILVTGYVYNLFSVSLVLLMAVSKRIVRFCIKLFIRIGAKLRICKDPEAALVKWEDVLDTFHTSVMMMRKHPLELLTQLLFGLLQLLALMAVTYFVYKGFGMTAFNYGQITALGVMLYISAAYTPLPGASGAQEGLFALFFSGAYPAGIRAMALLLWRFFTYYISLILGAIVSVGGSIRSNRKHKREEREAAKTAVESTDKLPT